MSAMNLTTAGSNGLCSSVPGSRRGVGLGWYYRGEDGYAEKEAREGSDHRYSPPLPHR
jgi:hypothetical protein